MRVVVISSDVHRRRTVARALRRCGFVVDEKAATHARSNEVTVLYDQPATLARSTEVLSNRGMVGRRRILLVDDEVGLCRSMKRLIDQTATDRNVEVEVDIAHTFDGALAELARGPVELFIIDVCFGERRDRTGLRFLEHVRERGITSPAYVITALVDYKIEATADALNARYIPKEGMELIALVPRLFAHLEQPAFPDSSVRLKRVSAEDAGEFLAHAPGGLRSGYLAARKHAVAQVVAEQRGNRTAAARVLGMTRQQVQDILRDEDIP